MNEEGHAGMSRTQQVTVTMLSLAVVMVFGCLGSYVLIYMREGQTPLVASRTDPVWEASIASGEPAAAADASDYGYRLCFQDVLSGSTQLADDLGVVSSLAKTDPQSACDTAAGLDLASRAAGLRAVHENCPEPSDPHLQAARVSVNSSLNESAEASQLIQRYCSEGQDTSRLEEAAKHMEEADHLWSQGELELEAYYESY
jgi:hypothetical protein